jgi:hypothetical protein
LPLLVFLFGVPAGSWARRGEASGSRIDPNAAYLSSPASSCQKFAGFG